MKWKWIHAICISCFVIGCSAEQSPETSAANPAIPAKQETNKNIAAKNSIKTTQKPNSLPESPKDSTQQKVLLDVPLISQNPELKYGCEVTSLTMVLQHAGIKVDKMELAKRVKKDNDPLSTSKTGDITRWGDPDDGFVGDMTGKRKGFAVYAKPLEELMEQYLPGRTINLTAKPFDDLLAQIKKGRPVVVWTTGDFKMPDRWESWNHGQEQIKTPLDLHAVVLVGFESDYVYVNDPLAVKKAYKVSKQSFIDSWIALGKQALSYR